MLNSRWASPGAVSWECSAWYRPRTYRPSVRSLSVGVDPPGSSRSDVSTGGRSWSSRDIDFDDILFHHFCYPSNGRPPPPINTPLFNKFVGGIDARGMWDVHLRMRRVHLRNINVGQLAVIRRLQVGTVARVCSLTYIHNFEGRMTNTAGAAFQISGAHHFGRNYDSPICKLNPPLPGHVRIVYADTRTFKWVSVDSAAFHSFVWPRGIREARGIART